MNSNLNKYIPSRIIECASDERICHNSPFSQLRWSKVLARCAMGQSRFRTSCVFILSFALQAQCLSVSQGSPCYDLCNGDQATSLDDIVCTDDDFASTNKGKLLERCVACLETSSFQNGRMTDPICFLCKVASLKSSPLCSRASDYLSTVQQTCLSGKLSKPVSNCSNSCGNITSSFSESSGTTFFQSPLSYCTTSSNGYKLSAPSCATCLQTQQDTVILGNCE